MTASSAFPGTGARRPETEVAAPRHWHLFLTEPLVWFALAGAAVFAAFHWLGMTEERPQVQMSDEAVELACDVLRDWGIETNRRGELALDIDSTGPEALNITDYELGRPHIEGEAQ